ncbi:MAG: hypothetical protein JWN03_3379 [Nocardia sp.]|uniref:MarR family transcriptional regulator n=1 Tax=Nocardia sp. TaxID=1821 RepID=UPI002636DB8D|nr:MarR family transcriptional regulator [Nocardia sp.]MCU1643104.1 hypothetical protein [Nocardia sp.]
MALTEPEAKVLGALSTLQPPHALTVQQLCRTTGLADGAIRRALRRLSHTGLALGTRHSPANWRPTKRGRLAVNQPGYRDYVASSTRRCPQ